MKLFSKKTANISVSNKNITLETTTGVNLYKFLLEEDLVTPTICNGIGNCGRCKVRYVSPNPPKANSKENLILAKMNIDMGYRLACQHIIKKDIEIDISEMISPVYKDIEVEEIKEDDTISISDFDEDSNKDNNLDIRLLDGPTDGILLIQQKNGIRYYCYSAALDNIVQEDTYPYNELLRDIVDNNMLPDFLYYNLKIRDIERVLVLIEGNDSYGAETILDMFRYLSIDVGDQQCELIMPRSAKSYEISHFFRLLNADKDNRIIFSLDMLNRVHYATNNIFVDMSFPLLRNTNFLSIKPHGHNPILSFNDDLEPATIFNKDRDIDGITLPALLQLVKLMLKQGIINNKFQLKSRGELTKANIPLKQAVRVQGQNEPECFYIYRSRFTEITLTQKELDELFQIKSYINAVTDYTKEYLGIVGGLVFYTTYNQENLINLMIDLGFIPEDLSNKIIYRPGEATIQAIKLFKEKDVKTYVDTYFKNVEKINLIDDNNFRKIAVANFLEI